MSGYSVENICAVIKQGSPAILNRLAQPPIEEEFRLPNKGLTIRLISKQDDVLQITVSHMGSDSIYFYYVQRAHLL